jgi:hypothetical protein
VQKALLISILAATMLIPFFASRGRTVKQSLRRSAIATAVFCFVYWLGLIFIYPSLTPSSRATSNPGAASGQ